MDKISALMDGELDARQTDQQYARLKHDPEARASWDTFHLIGDALRGECRGAAGFSSQLSSQMSARLAAEPTVLAPRRAPARHVTTYALSAAASLSAVALVGWVAFQNLVAPQAEIATAPVVAPLTPPAAAPSIELASVPSEGKMNEYLIAHQEFSPSTAIQGLAPYIRTVSATQTTKGRE